MVDTGRYLWALLPDGSVCVAPLRDGDVLKQPGLIIQRADVPRLAAWLMAAAKVPPASQG